MPACLKPPRRETVFDSGVRISIDVETYAEGEPRLVVVIGSEDEGNRLNFDETARLIEGLQRGQETLQNLRTKPPSSEP